MTKKQKLSEIYLYIGTFFMIIKTIFGLSAIYEIKGTVDDIIVIIAVVFFAASIITQQTDIKKLIIYCGISMVILFICINSDSNIMLISTLAIFALNEKNINNYLRFVYKMLMLLFILHIIYFLIQGIFGDKTLYYESKGMKRYMLGFMYANSPSIIFFNIVLIWLWLNYDSIRLVNIFFILLGAAVIVLLTQTRTMLIEIVLTVICIGIAKKTKISSSIYSLAVVIIPIILFLLINYMSKNYTGEGFINTINNALSDRIKLAAYAYKNYGITWFGQRVPIGEIEWDSIWKLNNFTFDCIYSQMLYNTGLLSIIILMLMMFRVYLYNDKKTSVFFIIWLVYGITEVHGLNGFMLFPILLISQLDRKGGI